MMNYLRHIQSTMRELMVMLGYVMALAAFFVVMAEFGEMTTVLEWSFWALVAVPLVYAVAQTALSIKQIRKEAE